MPNTHIFHLPIDKYRHGDIIGIPRGYQPPRAKRKRITDPEEEATSDQASQNDEEITKGNNDSTPTIQLTNFSRNELQQRAAAGLSPTYPIPEHPFPIASADYKARQHDPIKEAKDQLRQLRPPLYELPNFAEVQNGTQEQHLAVINTLVHKFICQGDYERASRAWGLLIRAMPQGTDVRSYGRWGIGAEILMRRHAFGTCVEAGEPEMSGALGELSLNNVDEAPLPLSRHSRQDDDTIQPARDTSVSSVVESNRRSTFEAKSDHVNNRSLSGDSSNPADSANSATWVPDSNLGLARDYYERLIIRHAPVYRNITPEQRVRQANWYPALMSVWIFQVTQRSRKAKALLKTLSEGRQVDIREDEMDVDGDDCNLDRTSEPDQPSVELERIRRSESEGAKEIAERLDNVLEGAPYDSDSQLLRLRGMIGHWIADLLRPMTQGDDEDDGYERSMQDVNMDYNAEIAQELQKARTMFDRAGDFQRPSRDGE